MLADESPVRASLREGHVLGGHGVFSEVRVTVGLLLFETRRRLK